MTQIPNLLVHLEMAYGYTHVKQKMLQSQVVSGDMGLGIKETYHSFYF